MIGLGQKPLLGALPSAASWASRGLVGAWMIREGVGGRLEDSSLWGNVGDLVGSPAWVPGGLEFTQAGNTRVDLANLDGYSATTGTIIVRCSYAGSTDATDYVLFSVYKDGAERFWLELDTQAATGGTNVEQYVFGYDPVGAAAELLVGNADATKWESPHVIAARWDYPNTMALFEDGLEVAEDTTLSGTIVVDPTALNIGGYADDTSFEWEGIINWMVLYDRMLTDSG